MTTHGDVDPEEIVVSVALLDVLLARVLFEAVFGVGLEDLLELQ